MVRASSEAAGTADHLWAKAAELERDFAGYKRRLADSRKPSSHHAAATAAEVAAGRRAGEVEGEDEERAGGVDDAAAVGGRGRRYEEYVRRRDERLRHEWRARMQRKEAEVHALWARLDRTGSSARRGGGGGDGELQLVAAGTTSHGASREDQVKHAQKPAGNVNLVVKLKPSTPVTPRGGHPPPLATAKLARPRTSVPSSSLAAAAGSPSARLSTPDPRRRPSHSHLHREQQQSQSQQPPATARKAENRLPPSATAAVTPRPRTTTTTMLSRSRSMFSKDRGCSSVGESPRPPPRFQPPRSSYDSASRQQPAPSPLADDAIAAVQSRQSISCPREPAVVADRNKASAAVALEPVLVRRRPGNGVGVEPASSVSLPPVVVPKKDLLPYSYSGEIAPATGCENVDNKSNQQECGDRSSDSKPGSEETMITGDSDTEPSYVYIKKDSDEQIPRPPQPADDNKEYKYSDSVEEDNVESTGSNEVTPAADADADEEEEFRRRESSESLYSNVQSSFSQRSLLDTSPESSNTSADAERRLPTPTTPRSSVSVQSSPMDAVNGLKRLLTFGKRNGNKASNEAAAAAAAAAERAPHSVIPAPPAPAGDDSSVITSRECPPAAGGSAKLTVESSDDLDSSYVISPHAHVRSLQSFGPSYPASSELKEPVLHAKSPRVHRSFFSFPSFKSKAN